MNLTVGQLEDYQKCLTKKSRRYLSHCGGWQFRDELGRYLNSSDIDFDEECEVISVFPLIEEREDFTLTNKPQGMPHDILIFQSESRNFRFLVRMSNYRMKIPFSFHSTDPRVGVSKAIWKMDTGKIVPVMKKAHHLSVFFADGVPTLHIDNITNYITVKTK